MTLSDEEVRLAEYRALREEAWRLVSADLAELQRNLAERGIGDRIKDRIGEEAQEVWDTTREIAAEHKGVVAATIAALVAWLLRGPIVEAISALLGNGEEHPPAENVDTGEGEST